MVFFAVLAGVFTALIGLSYLLYNRLTKAKGLLFAARQELCRTDARFKAAQKAAKAAEQRCILALQQLESALGQTGQALEVAGQIQVVSEQLNGLVAYIASPLDAPTPTPRRRGRHALVEDRIQEEVYIP